MQTDMTQALGTRVDFSRLVGIWFGIKLDENRFAKLQITEQDGTLLVHLYGSPDSELADWGQLEATPYTTVGSTMVTGFQVQCRGGGVQIDILGLEVQGVVLLQTFTSYHDDSGRTSEFAKAYYRRSPAEVVATIGMSTGTLSGEWVNSDPGNNWVAGFTLTEDAGTTTIRVHGASDPTDWGEAEVTTHMDRYGEPNFYAVFDLEPFEVVIGVVSVKNMVVLNEYRRFKDGDSTNAFRRELFFRDR